MVVVSILPYVEFGPNDRFADAPHFTFADEFWKNHVKNDFWEKSFKITFLDSQ